MRVKKKTSIERRLFSAGWFPGRAPLRDGLVFYLTSENLLRFSEDISSQTIHLSMSLKKSPPPQNRQLNILIGNGK